MAFVLGFEPAVYIRKGFYKRFAPGGDVDYFCKISERLFAKPARI